ncbi:MAG TPA: RagB/SusD family nutrient uptake outer membrane protein [Gemmatimonadales bacterium]|nr:RagB/SusD family nutrient uptake outer membrane protein [Gemmatimonadales bacterium]
MTRTMRFAAASLLALAACNDLDVADLNNPGLETLEQTPTPVALNTAATGLLIGLRNGVAVPNGVVTILGALGREGFNLNTNSDPRYVAELILGPLNPGSGAFGANIWAARYANIRNTVVVLHATEKVAGMSDAEKEGLRGFAKTIQALELLLVIATRDANGAVIDVDRVPTGEPGAIATKAEVYARIGTLLDEGRTHLLAAGTSFSFPLGSGFAGFDTPATFLKVNRAIRARAAVYNNEWATALTALGQSFLDTNAPLSLGAYHIFGTASGDTPNGILEGTPEIRANPFVVSSAQLRVGGAKDKRVTDKIETGESGTGSSGTTIITSDQHFKIYPTNVTPVAIIRNEELILLRAEANLGSGNLGQAVIDINFIRTNSGGLPPYAGAVTAAALLDELLYNKRYSLIWEGGHSWIDYRHYGKLTSLPRMVTGGKFFSKMPFPNNECLARTDAASQPGCAPEVGQ